MIKKKSSDFVSDSSYYYSIRILIEHETMPASEITEKLAMEPDISWSAGERNTTKNTIWNYTSWTTGSRFFFEEIREILEWLNEKNDFISTLITTGGKLHIIAQLSGNFNIGDELAIEALVLAKKMGVLIGVEVFPNMELPEEVGN